MQTFTHAQTEYCIFLQNHFAFIIMHSLFLAFLQNVDLKKLEKAEAKLKDKKQKRAADDAKPSFDWYFS